MRTNHSALLFLSCLGCHAIASRRSVVPSTFLLLLAMIFLSPVGHTQSCQVNAPQWVYQYNNYYLQGTGPTASSICPLFAGYSFGNPVSNDLTSNVAAGSQNVPSNGSWAACYILSQAPSQGNQIGTLEAGLYPIPGPCPKFYARNITSEICTKNCAGDPINPSNGDIYLNETDIQFSGASSGLAWRRFYNSGDTIGSDLPPGWRHSYGRSVQAISSAPYAPYPGASSTVSTEYPTPAEACTEGFAQIRAAIAGWSSGTAAFTPIDSTNEGGVCTVTVNSVVVGYLQIYSDPPGGLTTIPYEYDVIRDDGQVLRYPAGSSGPVNPPAVSIRLAVTGSGFTVTDDDDNVELYNQNGQLQSVTSRAGVAQTVSYDGNGQFLSVTDSFGNSLTVARYTPSGGITVNNIDTVTASGDGQITYSYTGNFTSPAVPGAGFLAEVQNLDGSTKSYGYYTGSLLQTETDELQNTTTWGYDSSNRGDSVQLPGVATATNLTYNYNDTTSTLFVDPLGAQRTFSFSRLGDVNKVTGISGSQCATCQEMVSTTYDTAGWVASRTDYNGNLTCYQNDPVRGLELYRVEGFAPGSTCPSILSTYTPQSGTLQRKIATTWNSTWREPSLITEANRTTAYTFIGSGNIHTKTVTDTTVTPNVARTWTYSYNNFGQVLTAKSPRTDLNSTTTYVYYRCPGTNCGQIDTIQNALGQVTTFGSYNAYGQPLTITDPNGVLTTLAYYPRELLESSQVTEGTFSETINYYYYPTALLEKVTMPDSSTVTYAYSPAHYLTDITDFAQNYIQYEVDALGNRIGINAIDPSGHIDYTQTRQYNALSQLYEVIGAAGSSQVTTTYGYDSNGNNTSIDAPLSRNTGQQFDVLNRLSQVTDPDSGIAILTYDAEDDLTQVSDPRTLLSTYTYNGFSQVLTTQLASYGTKTFTDTYDSFGNVKTYTDGRGAITTYTYDALNRVTSAAYKLSGVTDQTISYTYDTGSNGIGRLTGASDANHSMSWGYDPKGRVISKSQTVASVARTVDYGYTNGDLVTVTTPSGQTITYTYSDHLIASIAVNSTTLLSRATYEPFGPVSGWTWGNGTAEVRSYNTDGNPSVMGGPESHAYTYDYAFRITQITNASNSALTWAYQYDPDDHLTSAVDTSTNQGFKYDADGNRTKETGTVAGTYNLVTGTNRLSTITGSPARTYTYDADGDDVSWSSISLTFNNRDRLSTATVSSVQTTYIYNALGQRIEKSGGPAGTVIFVYDEAGHLEGEYSSSGALIEETVWLGDTPVATLQPVSGGIGIYYIHADHLNAPHMITQASNNAIVWRWDNDPFGSLAPTGTIAYNPRFPGQYYDVETGLFYNYFRDYDPQTGRYVESDPIGLFGGSYSTYSYVSDNPLWYFDNFGLTQCDIDTARQIAADSQTDLSFPNSYGSEDLGHTPNGRRITGLTIPQYGTILSSFYQQKLTDTQAAELLNTVVHESIHYTYLYNDPRQIENDNNGTGYPYAEANRRTTKALVKRFNAARKQCPCSK